MQTNSTLHSAKKAKSVVNGKSKYVRIGVKRKTNET